MIQIRDIKKTFGTGESLVEVLKGVSLQIEEEDYVVILGASGSGKSTFLNIISGLEHPDEGSVCYEIDHDNIEITTLSDRDLTGFRRDNIGFIFQQYYLLPNLTVEQNVKMGANLVGEKNFANIVEAVGLTQKLHKYPCELSGGEQQRVSVARALAKKPKYLFLDEPTGALDEQTGRQVLEYISQLQETSHCTIVMVTHNENIAEMANTVIKMNSGRICDVYHNETRKTAYEIGW